MTTRRSVSLFFQEGSSDKVYEGAIVEEPDGTFTVQVAWGRRGAPLQRGTKAVKVTLARAEAALDKVVREKKGKGYEEVTATAAPAAVAPPVGQGSASKAGVGSRRARLGQAAQLLTSCAPDELEGLLADEAWVAQQKLDGARVLVHVPGSGQAREVVATNRAGEVTELASAELLSCLAEATPGSILDGELVGGEYHAFDLLQHGTQDLRGAGYLDRWLELDALVDQLSGPVRLVAVARTEAEKRALFARLEAERAEGIVFKRRDAPYVPGRPASGGAQRKHKFVKSADVVIVANAGNAYAMVVLDAEGAERSVGKVFAGTTNASRKALDARLGAGERPVAEVEYLYATDDEQLFQPVFLRLREDKAAEECTLDQLVRTNRDVVAPRKSKPGKT